MAQGQNQLQGQTQPQNRVVRIQSIAQFQELVTSHTFVIVDFYADWCGPCHMVAPCFARLSAGTVPGLLAFASVDVDKQQRLAMCFGVAALPTFLLFKATKVVKSLQGANPTALTTLVQSLDAELSGQEAQPKSAEVNCSTSPYIEGIVSAVTPANLQDDAASPVGSTCPMGTELR